MKKILLIFALLCAITSQAQTRNDTVFYITEAQYTNLLCSNKYERAIIYAPEDCDNFSWVIEEIGIVYDNPIVFEKGNMPTYGIGVGFYPLCDGYSIIEITVRFVNPTVPPETTEELWKRQHESLELNAPEHYGYSYLWSTGETLSTITVTEPGTYTCDISDMCDASTQTFIVRDNVEISLATCDLESNLNMVTWQTTPEQAEYIDHVKVKRDGMEVGTANYTDGYFIDNIGSDAASRTYTLVAVTPEGEDCPIVSYPKETIHMSYTLGVNNTIEVGWNSPSGYDLLGYNVCEWIPNGKEGDLIVIDFVGAGVTSYTCQASQFENGSIVVQGVENDKSEDRLLSNRSEEILSIGEHQNKNFKIYPNPSNGTFTVEGVSNLTIYNTLGQAVATSHNENDTHTFSLRSGIYFIKSDEGIVQKVVVE